MKVPKIFMLPAAVAAIPIEMVRLSALTRSVRTPKSATPIRRCWQVMILEPRLQCRTLKPLTRSAIACDAGVSSLSKIGWGVITSRRSRKAESIKATHEFESVAAQPTFPEQQRALYAMAISDLSRFLKRLEENGEAAQLMDQVAGLIHHYQCSQDPIA